ncbi:RcpC/CpaB family pilus assembly protein [Arthrobacter sp. SDTb3-6]|uniref:RcpC/CpaB family pilus assembly protein n=1 Tax=Arthrobacter sp. SDTb3-6 TaxID=2713571 RepID=UPI001844B5E4|nr:RcpC/CpaB family pilus assembly protein [Arthrobacter sp. SDTb3-6]NVM97240.1 flagellar biosynthesis protein FlgA [Arthrobacter sp. SDTb3-6]
MRSSTSPARRSRQRYYAPPSSAPWGRPWSARPHPAPAPHRLWRWVRRRRRLAAALLLCAAAAIAVQQLTPAPPATAPVLVAARDLPAGHVLALADLTAAAVSPAMVPAGSLAPPGSEVLAGQGVKGPPGSAAVASRSGHAPTWVGMRLSGPVRRGEVVTDAALLGDGLLVGAAPGSQAVPLRLTDPTTVQLLRQGQQVDVVLSAGTGLDGPMKNELLARSVAVLWTPALSAPGGGLLPVQDTEGLVVVAATHDQALQLAGASARGKIFLVLVK